MVIEELVEVHRDQAPTVVDNHVRTRAASRRHAAIEHVRSLRRKMLQVMLQGGRESARGGEGRARLIIAIRKR
jgi:hypothetical protein